MKTFLIASLLIVAGVFSVSAQSPAASEHFNAKATSQKQPQRKAAQINQKAVVDGVVPRAVRGGNPLQMLNPKAPRKYGTAEEAVTYDWPDPYYGYKWKGIKLFEIRF